MSQGHSHRPSLKQSNKSFKSRHSSKGSLRDAAKGRVEGNGTASGNAHGKKTRSGASISASQSKANRRNNAKQIQLAKRQAVIDKGKLTKGAEGRAPRVVAVIQLCEDSDGTAIINELLGAAADLVNTETVSETAHGIKQVDLLNPRATLQFLTPAHGDLVANLDAVATADFVVLSISGTVEVGPWGETCLRSIASLGIGEGAVRGIVSALPENATAVTQVRKSLHSFLRHFFPSLERLHAPSVGASEAMNLVRSLGDRLPRGVIWRETRARVLAEEIAWLPEVSSSEQQESGDEVKGTLAVTGVIRGSTLSANRLVHIQGLGDFQVAKIVDATLQTAKAGHKKKAHNGMDDAPGLGDILSEPTPSEADDLVSTNAPSEGDLMNEQTWPTEDEIASAPANAVHRTFGAAATGDSALMPPPALPGTTPRRLKKVPKGTSVYQAAWIPDESDDDDDGAYGDYDDDDGEGMREDGENGERERLKGGGLLQSDEEYEYIDMDATDSQARGGPATSTGFTGLAHSDLPMDVENAQYQSYLADRRATAAERDRENKDDLEFPDEVDTPLETPARERFARYRGLKSFRTSRWDPYENLPRDYARCFMFSDYKVMSRKLAQRAAEEGIEAGARVTVYIKDVPASAATLLQRTSQPLVVFGLLKHEHKFSVANFTCVRNTEYSADIKAKDSLIIQLGCRRFNINPLWSQHTQGNGGKGANNVHKFERFLRHGPTASVGTAYLPITFGNNVPAIVFQQTSDGLELVGSGSLLAVDPTRIIAKRIILTGHPYKVHKKTATIRYMFFNQPDVEYYKPVELRTKKGRVGHIKESLGTHGYFKAGFDGPIDQMDTICLNLYKRCYPKWGTFWKGEQAAGDAAPGASIAQTEGEPLGMAAHSVAAVDAEMV